MASAGDFDARRFVPPRTAAEALDHQAICHLAKTYALGFDLRDFALARSAWSVDGTITEGGKAVPVDQGLKRIYDVAASFLATQHLVAQQYVSLDGDEAVLWSYAIAHHKVANGDARDEVIAGVQYRDTCRRQDGDWKIGARDTALLWLDVRPRR